MFILCPLAKYMWKFHQLLSDIFCTMSSFQISWFTAWLPDTHPKQPNLVAKTDAQLYFQQRSNDWITNSQWTHSTTAFDCRQF